jgi:hypothetical protein
MKGVQSDGHDVTLVSMKIPIPFSFPYCKCVINDIPVYQNSTMLLFAVNTIECLAIKFTIYDKHLPYDLDTLAIWERKWNRDLQIVAWWSFDRLVYRLFNKEIE